MEEWVPRWIGQIYIFKVVPKQGKRNIVLILTPFHSRSYVLSNAFILNSFSGIYSGLGPPKTSLIDSEKLCENQYFLNA